MLGAGDSPVQPELREDPAALARPEPAAALLGQDAADAARPDHALRQAADRAAARLARPVQHHRGDGAYLVGPRARLDPRQDHRQGRSRRLRAHREQVRRLPAPASPERQAEHQARLGLPGRSPRPSRGPALRPRQAARVLEQSAARFVPGFPLAGMRLLRTVI